MVSIFRILNKTQDELLQFCKHELKQCGYKKMISTKQYIFAQGEIPVMLVAHLDTVHKDKPEIYFDRSKQVLWSPNGIGGDDRCGVYAILKICETYKPYVLFTTDEECGALGASAFCEDFENVELKSKINFIIEIDRRGCNEAVFYDCGNLDFQNYILSFGFTKNYGSFSDISVVSPEFDIASVNLSAGYRNEHTKEEHIFLDDLNQTIAKVIKILEDKENHKYYDYQECKYVLSSLNNSSALPWYIEDDYIALNDEEWELYYGYPKPKTYKKLEKKFKNYYWDYDKGGKYAYGKK